MERIAVFTNDYLGYLRASDGMYKPAVVVGAATNLDALAGMCHAAAVHCGWWHDPVTGEPKERNTGEMIALMHSELSEALEGARKSLKDQHLPHHDSLTVELADCIIRILDFAGKHRLPIGQAFGDKVMFNLEREDHKPENRAKEGGKKF